MEPLVSLLNVMVPQLINVEETLQASIHVAIKTIVLKPYNSIFKHLAWLFNCLYQSDLFPY